MEIKEAITDEEIRDCWKAVQALRTHVKEEEYLERVKKQQKEGYHLMYIRDKISTKVESITGWRTLNQLFCGKTLYVDDLSTLPEGRGKGYAGALLDWVKKYAKENGYETVALDSGYTRNTAHRLYLNKGFDMTCHHFEIRNVQNLKI